MSGEPIICLATVSKAYRKGGQVLQVLDGLDLTVARGEFVALMGPSGSGKSTILNLIGGLDVPDRGQVNVVGVSVPDLSGDALATWRARYVAYVFQAFNLIPVLTAQENVELPLLLAPLGRSERRRQALFALDLVGLSDRRDHKPKQLSGGQEQRVAIARAIAMDPDILLCDEPTGDLDRQSADQVLDLLSQLSRKHGKTVVVVTHDVSAAKRADRTITLEKGALVSS